MKDQIELGGILICVSMNAGKDFLEIGERGVLAVPTGVVPDAFEMIVAVKDGSRTVVVQKACKMAGGYYTLPELPKYFDGYRTFTSDPIRVRKVGGSVWTEWRGEEAPNNVDVWNVQGRHARMYQVAVVTHDDGKTYQVIGEIRWEGCLYETDGRIVGCPDDPAYGSFDVRRTVLDVPEFAELVDSSELGEWTGEDEELNPPLSSASEPGTAVVDYYSAASGRAGQGLVTMFGGLKAWVFGPDMKVEPGPDGIKRVKRGARLKFVGTAPFGNGKPSVKITGVEVVERG